VCEKSRAVSFRAIFLPGSVLPGELAYGALLAALGSDADAIARELEVYADAEPPSDYSLDTEVAGVLREADARGWERFHLAGYSGGGAAALAFTAGHPDRLLSLALLEPAWAGNWEWSKAEHAVWDAYEQLEGLPPDELMPAFARLNVKPGVSLPAPPAGEPPPWMAKRPAGIRAFMETFTSYDLDREELERFHRPVYYALGGLSNPDQFGEIAKRLNTVFIDFELEVFKERHHFDPPHRIEPERLANSLRTVWQRAEQSVPPQ
jgi:pimeloyl-ACP methyl ester carboxylesterase